MRLPVALLSFVFFAVSLGCAHDLTPEERLERDLQATPVAQEIAKADLDKINCQDTHAALVRARIESRPEPDRLTAYTALYDSVQKKVAALEEAMAKNPDLRYRQGSQELVAQRDLCVQQRADVRMDLERFTRELVEVPTVQEIRGGSSHLVPRLDYKLLREAIEALNPEDKETLLGRVAVAERKLASHPAEPHRKK